MLALDLLNESVNYKNEEETVVGLGESYAPGMEGLLEMSNANLEDEMMLEMAILTATNKQARLLAEGKNEEAMTLSENLVKNTLNKVVELIKKMWARMKDFFKGIRTYFDKLLMNEKKFVEKYGDDIKKISSVKVSGHNLDLSKVPSLDKFWTGTVAPLVAGEKKALALFIADIQPEKATEEAAKESFEKAKSAIKSTSDFKKAMQNGSKKEFKTDLLEKAGVEAKKAEVTYSGSEIISVLGGLNNAINEIKEAENGINTTYNKALAEVKEIINAAEVANKKLSSYGSKAKALGNGVVSNVKAGLEFVNTVAGVKMSLLKMQASQAKQAAYKGIAELRKEDKKEDKGEKTPVSESFNSVEDLYKSLIL